MVHHTEGLDPTKDVVLTEIGRKLVDLTKMTERSPKKSSSTVLEVKEPRKRVGWDWMRSESNCQNIKRDADEEGFRKSHSEDSRSP